MKHCEATVTVTVPVEVIVRLRGKGDPDDPADITPNVWEIDDVVHVSSAPLPIDVEAALDLSHRTRIAMRIEGLLLSENEGPVAKTSRRRPRKK